MMKQTKLKTNTGGHHWVFSGTHRMHLNHHFFQNSIQSFSLCLQQSVPSHGSKLTHFRLSSEKTPKREHSILSAV